MTPSAESGQSGGRVFKDGLRDLEYVQLVDLVAPAFNPKRSCHWQQAGKGITMPKRKQWVRGSMDRKNRRRDPAGMQGRADIAAGQNEVVRSAGK